LRLLYKYHSFYKSYQRMLETGDIEKIIKNGRAYIRLTGKAKNRLQRDYGLFGWQKQSWDGKWRLVVFDIEEKRKYLRNKLRSKLKELGFGKLQRSIYISPYDLVEDIYEWLKAENLLGDVLVLTAKHELMGQAEELAQKIWQIDKLEEKYSTLEQDIRLAKKEKKPEKILELKNHYLEFLKIDPHLPFDLLPGNWVGERVKKLVAKL